jgi:sporulation and spore germination protein
MSRGLKTTIAILSVMVVLGLITLPSLRRAIEGISGSQRTEEQARRDVMQAPVETPTDVRVKAQMYWLSAASATSLEATTIELPLSADPVERSKQLLIALIADAPAPNQRTLPPDAILLAFYIQPDGTAVADFSDALPAETPSGILSEQLVADSITQTLGANVNVIRQLKILIHGQEAETLAGHLDLSGFFSVPSPVAAATSASKTPATPPVTVTKPVPATPAPSAPAKQVPH